MADTFESYARGLSSPATGAFSITPNDTLDFEQPPRGIYIGATGLITVTTLEGEDVQLYLIAGTILPLRVRRVWESGHNS